LSAEDMREVETASNRALREDLHVSAQYMTLPEAKAWGALALFGETYGDQVRVVQIGGPWSRELCGGTHVARASQIGTVVLTSQSSVGAGHRRVEALTGLEGFGYLARERDLLAQVSATLNARPEDVPGRIDDVLEQLHRSDKELSRLRKEQMTAAAGQIAAEADEIGGVAFVGHRAEAASGGDIRSLATDIRGRLGQRPGVVAVIGTADDKPALVVTVNSAAQDRGLNASDLL